MSAPSFDRRSVLRLAGASGLVVAGGAVLGGATALNGAATPAHAPSGRRPRYRRAVWSQQLQRGHGWTAAGAGTVSSDLGDSADLARGNQSVRVTTDGSGRQSYVRRTGMTGLDLTGRMIRLTFRVEDTTRLARLAFYVGTDSFANHFVWQFHTHSATAANYVQSGEWVTVHLQWADVTSAAGTCSIGPTGVPSPKAGFTDMSFAVYDNAGGPVTYWLRAVELVPDTTSVFPKGVVSVTFDDSHGSVHDLARPVMDPYGFPGTSYNIADAIGAGGSLTIGRMRSLQDHSGWEMAGHAYATSAHAAGYGALTAQQVDDDFRRMREWLVSNGFTSEHFAYPHGAFGKTKDGVPVDLLAARHFTTARSIISETTESFAPAMPYRLKALTGITDGNGIGGTVLSRLTSPGGRLDRCATNGDWLILCLHRVVAGRPRSSTEISQSGLAALMKAISDRHIPVATVGEVIEYHT
ncbi:polysaccharide deacetylase family protein [Streptomyces barringtoniae]|uniref:polysaccharide deacetylase family protein n=1 Tax=Streptomyces barringtoniae TaxID=2892029 RepID=UPI001E5DAFD8|nr:polysaccharide deacetylase family protein [Streptomyces barringtoniae]MCC5477021.1 polysaccharide deacetylase family protein [Streptomyces barringtoniae]